MSSSDSATTATATTAPAEGAAHAGSGTTALLLTTLSGLSTGLGAVVVLAAGQPSPRKLGHLLAFSAGVMIYLSFADLLFSSIDQLSFLTANIAVCPPFPFTLSHVRCSSSSPHLLFPCVTVLWGLHRLPACREPGPRAGRVQLCRW